MSRLLLQYLLPLLFPAAIYFGWVWLARRTGKGQAGGLTPLREGPWFWLVAAGLALMVAGLVFTALMGQGQVKGTYEPPRFEGGRVVPGTVK
ncbi:MAG: hypothetical protein O6829_09760 [Alphaproteobacteria bacterium]|nr:hypothetical protein [Alphaproteobacteria bacterium]